MKSKYNIIEYQNDLPIKSKNVKICEKKTIQYRFSASSVAEINQVLEQMTLDLPNEFDIDIEYDKSNNIVGCVIIISDKIWKPAGNTEE